MWADFDRQGRKNVDATGAFHRSFTSTAEILLPGGRCSCQTSKVLKTHFLVSGAANWQRASSRDSDNRLSFGAGIRCTFFDSDKIWLISQSNWIEDSSFSETNWPFPKIQSYMVKSTLDQRFLVATVGVIFTATRWKVVWLLDANSRNLFEYFKFFLGTSYLRCTTVESWIPLFSFFWHIETFSYSIVVHNLSLEFKWRASLFFWLLVFFKELAFNPILLFRNANRWKYLCT